MEFFTSAVGVLQTLVIAVGAGLGIWGVINLLEGYGNDNPGAKSQGMKQLMAGGGVALIGLPPIEIMNCTTVSNGSFRFRVKSFPGFFTNVPVFAAIFLINDVSLLFIFFAFSFISCLLDIISPQMS